MDNSKFQELVLKRFDLLDLIAAQVGKLTTKVDGLTTKVDGLTTQVDRLTTQVDGLTTRVDRLATRVDNLTEDMAEVKADLQFTKNVVIRIENEHGQKFGALMNGYKQNAARLDRHEAIISKKYK